MSFGSSGIPAGFTLTSAGTGSLLIDNNPSSPITRLTIGGPIGSNGTPGADTADTVNLASISSAMIGNLSVSAGTVNFSPGATVATGVSLSVSATTINFGAGAAVESYGASLTSVNSLTFASTGVPYLGSVTHSRRSSLGTTLCRRPIHHRTRLGHVWLRAWRYDYHLERGHSVQWHPNANVHRRRHSRGQPVPRFHCTIPNLRHTSNPICQKTSPMSQCSALASLLNSRPAC